MLARWNIHYQRQKGGCEKLNRLILLKKKSGSLNKFSKPAFFLVSLHHQFNEYQHKKQSYEKEIGHTKYADNT